jgi:hypothetical protein
MTQWTEHDEALLKGLQERRQQAESERLEVIDSLLGEFYYHGCSLPDLRRGLIAYGDQVIVALQALDNFPEKCSRAEPPQHEPDSNLRMTVGELMAKLAKVPPTALLAVYSSDGRCKETHNPIVTSTSYNGVDTWCSIYGEDYPEENIATREEVL